MELQTEVSWQNVQEASTGWCGFWELGRGSVGIQNCMTDENWCRFLGREYLMQKASHEAALNQPFFTQHCVRFESLPLPFVNIIAAACLPLLPFQCSMLFSDSR